jgi:methanol dehydrogenase (cytochrome c) subunit 1
MDHQAKGICPSAMGYHNQGIEPYEPNKQLFFTDISHICMDWELFILPYCAGQFFVSATLNMYPGPKGTLGQVFMEVQIAFRRNQASDYLRS